MTCPILLAGPVGDNGHAHWPAQTAMATLECDDEAFFGAPLVAKLVLTADADVEDPCSWRALFGALRVTAVANPPIVGFALGHPKTTIAGLRVEYLLELPAITSEQVPFCPAKEGHMELAVEMAAPPLSASLGAAPAAGEMPLRVNAKPPPRPPTAAAGSSGIGTGIAGDGSSRASDERILPLLLAPDHFPFELAPGASYALACCTPPGEDYVLTVCWRPMPDEAVRGAVDAAPQSLDTALAEVDLDVASLDTALAEVDLDVASPVRCAPVLPDTAPRMRPDTAPRMLLDARRCTPPCDAPHGMAIAPSRAHEVHFLIAAAPRATNELVGLAAIAPTTALALGHPFSVTLQLTNRAKEPWEELVLTFTPAPTVLCLTERVRVGSLKLGQTTSVVVQMVGLVVGMVAERLEVVGRSTSGAELHAFQASCLVYVRIVDPLLTGAMESTGTPAPP